MDELIYKQPLLNAMDERYNEKVNIVPDNLAEGFMQMEKLIKEQPVITKQQIEEEAINRFVATLIPRLTDFANTSLYPRDTVAITRLVEDITKEVRDNDDEFFNFDSSFINVDQKSYLKGYRQGLADKEAEMDKVKEEGYGKGVNDFAKTISPYISEYQKTIKQNRFAFIDVYGIAGRLVENYNNE